MSAVWRWRREPTPVEPTAVPIAPADPDEVRAMRASALFDLHDRRNQALAIIAAALADPPRDPRDVLLDVRNVLLPPEPLPLRPSVPVIPGRTS